MSANPSNPTIRRAILEGRYSLCSASPIASHANHRYHAADVPEILKLIHELANFEKSSDKVHATEAALASTISFAPSRANPSPKPAVAHCLLLTLPPEHPTTTSAGSPALSSNPAFNPPPLPETTGAAAASSPATDADRIVEAQIAREGAAERVAGFALFFYNYSTWHAAPGVYLEDLFVRPEFRRQNFATKLLARLATEVGLVGGGRLEWSCLRWNEGALRFYERIGGKTMDDWVGVRIEGRAAVSELAALGQPSKP